MKPTNKQTKHNAMPSKAVYVPDYLIGKLLSKNTIGKEMRNQIGLGFAHMLLRGKSIIKKRFSYAILLSYTCYILRIRTFRFNKLESTEAKENHFEKDDSRISLYNGTWNLFSSFYSISNCRIQYIPARNSAF